MMAPEPEPINPRLLTSHEIRRAILAIFDKHRDLRASAVDIFRHPEMKGVPDTDEFTRVGYHVRVLETAGILVEVDTGQVRGAQKRILALTDKGIAFLDGEGYQAQADAVLDRMAVICREHGQDDPSAAYKRLAELLASTGRKVGRPEDEKRD